jgi:hypothetical protein
MVRNMVESRSSRALIAPAKSVFLREVVAHDDGYMRRPLILRQGRQFN